MTKSLISVLFFYSLNLFASEVVCDTAEISHKIKNKVTSISAEVCTNQYGQFFSSNCKDGCEFKTKIANYFTVLKNNNYGTPGSGVCSKIGYTSYISEIKFKGNLTKNIDLCFGSEAKTFVSTGFLADLTRKVSK